MSDTSLNVEELNDELFDLKSKLIQQWESRTMPNVKTYSKEKENEIMHQNFGISMKPSIVPSSAKKNLVAFGHLGT